MDRIAQHCRQTCPDDCDQEDFESTLKLEKSSEELDLASLNTVQVQISRDKDRESIQLEQFPLMDSDSFIAQLGGSIAFWLALAWIGWWIVGLLEFLYELFQIYKH